MGIRANVFDADMCAEADVVWSEWCNELAFEAAASGVCKRLVIRLRGYDVWAPLDRLKWSNVAALVCESPMLKALVAERFPSLPIAVHVLPSGVDVTAIPYTDRTHGTVVALAAVAAEIKGHQLAFEWARQRPDIQLHVAVALGETNPRLTRYLAYACPSNVTLYGGVDTVPWLDSIHANYLLSTSLWETLGYTIVEAMAMGIKPLVHETPGSALNWPELPTWRNFRQLNQLIDPATNKYESVCYRAYVAQHLDAAQLSPQFASLVLGGSLTAP